MTPDFPYKIAWITGASRGIGLAIAETLVAHGVNVALSARDAQGLAEAAAIIQRTMPASSAPHFASSARIISVVCDVRDVASIESAYATIVSILGEPSLLVNNAGVGVFAPLLETSAQDIDLVLSTNLRGALLTMQSVARAMMQMQHGAIVNINSVAAIKTFFNCSVYAASKAGLLAASRGAREELRPYGVKVIDLLVGATETALWNKSARDEFHERMMQPQDIAKALMSVLEMPPRLMPEEITMRPQLGDV